MAEIGRFNSLIVLRSTPQGLYLDGGEQGIFFFPNAMFLRILRKALPWRCS